MDDFSHSGSVSGGPQIMAHSGFEFSDTTRFQLSTLRVTILALLIDFQHIVRSTGGHLMRTIFRASV